MEMADTLSERYLRPVWFRFSGGSAAPNAGLSL